MTCLRPSRRYPAGGANRAVTLRCHVRELERDRLLFRDRLAERLPFLRIPPCGAERAIPTAWEPMPAAFDLLEPLIADLPSSGHFGFRRTWPTDLGYHSPVP